MAHARILLQRMKQIRILQMYMLDIRHATENDGFSSLFKSSEYLFLYADPILKRCLIQLTQTAEVSH